MRALIEGFQGLKFTLDHLAHSLAVPLQPGDVTGLSLDPTTLNTGQNSGYQAINLAVLLGAAKVVLLGYDMQIGSNGQSHWWGEHAWKTRPPVDLFRPHFATLVEPLKRLGVEIVNCSRVTTLDYFRRASIQEALA